MEQARKPQFTAMQKVMVGLTLCGVMYLLFGTGTSSPARKFDADATLAVCAAKAGITGNGKVYQTEATKLSACVDEELRAHGLR